MTGDPTPMETLNVSWRRVRHAAHRAGLTAKTMHLVVDPKWRELLTTAFVAARVPSKWDTADLHRWRWRSHALQQIEHYRQLHQGDDACQD